MQIGNEIYGRVSPDLFDNAINELRELA
jgi:hypothetical protein